MFPWNTRQSGNIRNKYLLKYTLWIASDQENGTTACAEDSENVGNKEKHVIYEDHSINYKNNVNSLSGTDIAALLQIGTRVVRGPDWKWGDQVNFSIFLMGITFLNGFLIYLLKVIILFVQN